MRPVTKTAAVDPRSWAAPRPSGVRRYVAILTPVLRRPVLARWCIAARLRRPVPLASRDRGVRVRARDLRHGQAAAEALRDQGRRGKHRSPVPPVIAHLGDTHAATLAIGAGALVLLFAGERWFPRLPGGLVVLVLGIGVSAILTRPLGESMRLISSFGSRECVLILR